MILIADSGSTKTDWCLIHSPQTSNDIHIQLSISTQGINPVHQEDAVIRQILADELLPQLTKDIVVSEAYFYGAGCTEIYRGKVEAALKETLQLSIDNIHVYSDLLASARALCKCEEGLVGILGTGSNSCLYDGKNIVKNIPPLGYILGDEGSGAVLGKQFLNGIFKGSLSQDIKDDFLQSAGLTYSDVIQKVYRQPMANRFLASISAFIHQHLDNQGVRELVIGNFQQFIQKNILPYGRPDLPFHCVGSIAYYYQEELTEACRREGITLGKVLKAPMEGLIAYHTISAAD